MYGRADGANIPKRFSLFRGSSIVHHSIHSLGFVPAAIILLRYSTSLQTGRDTVLLREIGFVERLVLSARFVSPYCSIIWGFAFG